ncbi:hypothetical protein ACOSQ3_005548 [Xanthoceras sorbifolium]
MKRGDGSVLEAELWGVLKVLQLVWDTSFKNVQVECDSLAAVCCSRRAVMKGMLSLALCRIARCFWKVIGDTSLIMRLGNATKLLTLLLEFDHSLSWGILFFEEPPVAIAVFEDDARGFLLLGPLFPTLLFTKKKKINLILSCTLQHSRTKYIVFNLNGRDTFTLLQGYSISTTNTQSTHSE